jgi:hypothetical protein
MVGNEIAKQSKLAVAHTTGSSKPRRMAAIVWDDFVSVESFELSPQLMTAMHNARRAHLNAEPETLLSRFNIHYSSWQTCLLG